MSTRGIEDIRGILQTWPEGFWNSFRRKLSKAELRSYLLDLRERKELESMKNQFELFKPVEIDLLLKELQDNEFDFLSSEEPKKKKAK